MNSIQTRLQRELEKIDHSEPTSRAEQEDKEKKAAMFMNQMDQNKEQINFHDTLEDDDRTSSISNTI